MKEFTKADLKNRMVVEYRNGERRIVVDDMLMGEGQFGNLKEYDDDLIFIKGSDMRGLDIVKVFDKINALIERKGKYLVLLWVRSEAKEVTMSEIEEKFGCKVKIVKE